MTNTETKFRKWANKLYPEGFIVKIPDFKQMGSRAAVGLPDYMVINKGKTIWYEVKSTSGKTLNLKNHFTEAQRIVFHKMLMAEAEIWIYWFPKNARTTLLNYGFLEETGIFKAE